MQVTINIEKRYALILSAVLILAIAMGVTYAYTINPGTIPTVGHALESIQGLFDGDVNLRQTLSTSFCQKDGTNCPTTLNQDMVIDGDLNVTGNILANRAFENVVCETGTTVGSCFGTEAIPSPGQLNSNDDCAQACEDGFNQAKIQNGCWLRANNGYCYCRYVGSTGSTYYGGFCGPGSF